MSYSSIGSLPGGDLLPPGGDPVVTRDVTTKGSVDPRFANIQIRSNVRLDPRRSTTESKVSTTRTASPVVETPVYEPTPEVALPPEEPWYFRKIGPLPVWAVGLLGVTALGGAVWYMRRKP